MNDKFDHALERALAAEECLRRLMLVIVAHLPSTQRELNDLFAEYKRVIAGIEKDAQEIEAVK